MDTKASVASLLGSAAGAAEAMTDCGIDTDDTELVGTFVDMMDKVRGEFMGVIETTMAKMRAGGVTDDQMNDAQTACMLSMQQSPAFTSPWFLWRLAVAVKAMASADVLEAARAVVEGHREWDAVCSSDTVPYAESRKRLEAMERAIRQLAAALPKEAE